MIIQIAVDTENNEGTSSPWWMIIDPRQSMSTKKEACHDIAAMITGPFFSRASAQAFLDATRYNFGPNAVVYCASGCYSREYENAIKKEA